VRRGIREGAAEREVPQIEWVTDWPNDSEVWRSLCMYTERCPTGQIKRGGSKMAKKTLKKSKKIEATKPLMTTKFK
jgi:hypothetical protein